MRPQMIMFFVFVLIVGNLMCLMADGDWPGTTDQNQMDALAGFNVNNAADAAIVTQSPTFFTTLWKAITWDFSFLEGGLQIIRWILLCLTVGAVFAIGQEFRSVITSILGRR